MRGIISFSDMNSGKIIKINNLDKKEIIIIIIYFLSKLLILFMSEEIKTIIIIIFRRMLTIFGNILNNYDIIIRSSPLIQ